MQYVIGAVGALLFVGGLGAAFLLGEQARASRKRAATQSRPYGRVRAFCRGGHRAHETGTMRGGTPRTASPTGGADAGDDEAEKLREEQLKKDLLIISGYNLNKALERKKAT